MTHPLTPREKVAAFLKERDEAVGVIDADDAERRESADAILTALASGSGDHAKLARLAEAATPGPWHSAGGYLTVRDPDGRSFSSTIYHLDEMGQRRPTQPFQAVPFARAADAAFIAAANPATILALLAENAALRGEHVPLVEQKEGAEDALFNALSRATEAERKLAEAVAVIERLASSEAFDIPRAIDGPLAAEVRARMDYARNYISKEAERG